MEQLLPGLSSSPNLHPMMVHFPIAFWVAATGAWLLWAVRKSDFAWQFGLWLHGLAAAGAVVAVVFGFLATEAMGHDSPGHGLVHVHRDLMLWATGLAFVISGVAWWNRRERLRLPLTILSLVLTALMALGADRGAELVFRYGVGVAHEEPPKSDHTHSRDGNDGHHAPANAPEPDPEEPEASTGIDSEKDAPKNEKEEPAQPSRETPKSAPGAAPQPTRHKHPAHKHSTHEQ